METNEALRSALMTIVETGIEKFVLTMQEVAEGNLQELEQQILVQIMAMGRDCLEQILEDQAGRSGSAARREGARGHHLCEAHT